MFLEFTGPLAAFWALDSVSAKQVTVTASAMLFSEPLLPIVPGVRESIRSGGLSTAPLLRGAPC